MLSPNTASSASIRQGRPVADGCRSVQTRALALMLLATVPGWAPCAARQDWPARGPHPARPASAPRRNRRVRAARQGPRRSHGPLSRRVPELHRPGVVPVGRRESVSAYVAWRHCRCRPSGRTGAIFLRVAAPSAQSTSGAPPSSLPSSSPGSPPGTALATVYVGRPPLAASPGTGTPLRGPLAAGGGVSVPVCGAACAIPAKARMGAARARTATARLVVFMPSERSWSDTGHGYGVRCHRHASRSRLAAPRVAGPQSVLDPRAKPDQLRDFTRDHPDIPRTSSSGPR